MIRCNFDLLGLELPHQYINSRFSRMPIGGKSVLKVIPRHLFRSMVLLKRDFEQYFLYIDVSSDEGQFECDCFGEVNTEFVESVCKMRENYLTLSIFQSLPDFSHFFKHLCGKHITNVLFCLLDAELFQTQSLDFLEVDLLLNYPYIPIVLRLCTTIPYCLLGCFY